MDLKRALRERLAPLKGTPAWRLLRALGRAYDVVGSARRALEDEVRWRLARRRARSPDPVYDRWLNRPPSAPPAEPATPAASFLVVLWRPPGADESAVERSRGSLLAQRWPGLTIREASGPSRAQATNEAVAASSAYWVLFLEAGDVLGEGALAAIAAKGEGADLVYTDEDRWLAGGELPVYDRPYFKPGWSPDALLSADWLGGAKALRREIYLAAGGLRDGFEGAEEHDLVLRALPRLTTVRHVEEPLYHRARPFPDAPAASRRAVAEHVARTYGPRFSLGESGLRYDGEPRVSLVVPFKDKPELLRELAASLFARTSYPRWELVLVSNDSRLPETRALVEELARRPNVRALEWNHPFNWSAINNWAARQCVESDLLLFMNNDMTVGPSESWLHALVAHAERPDVCVTGAKLLYPDGTIQHYGVVMGMGGGFAGHVFAGGPEQGVSPFGPTSWVRDSTAVTGACLMIERALFERLGGFDESFILCGSDVELCLRAARETGRRVVCTPDAVLVHHESKSRGSEIPFNDFVRSFAHYAPYLAAGDPYYNRNLSLAKALPAPRLAPEDALASARAVVGDAAAIENRS